MFNLTDYLLSKGIASDIVDRIVSRIGGSGVTITSADDFNNYRAKQLGLQHPILIDILTNAGIVFQD